MTVRRFLPAALFGFIALSSLSAAAEHPAASETRRPGHIAREGVDNLLRAFDQFIAAIPQYAMPELNAKGDIIIRRKNPQVDKLNRGRETKSGDGTVEI